MSFWCHEIQNKNKSIVWLWMQCTGVTNLIRWLNITSWREQLWQSKCRCFIAFTCCNSTGNLLTASEFNVPSLSRWLLLLIHSQMHYVDFWHTRIVARCLMSFKCSILRLSSECQTSWADCLSPFFDPRNNQKTIRFHLNETKLGREPRV